MMQTFEQEHSPWSLQCIRCRILENVSFGKSFNSVDNLIVEQ